jgi:hypothetical protein
MSSKTAEYSRRYRERHPDRVKAAQKKYCEANREKRRAACAAYRSENLEKERARIREWARVERATNGERRRAYARLRRRADSGNPTAENPAGICPLCLVYSDKLVFDHWHIGPRKGLFRGWPCSGCNTRLGGPAETVEWHARAVRYLNQLGEPPDTASGAGEQA